MWRVLIILSSLAASTYGADDCSNNPCQGGGQCVPGSPSSCKCLDGYTGSNCQFASCSSIPISLSIGYNPILRGGLDGSLQWTMVQKEGFKTDGTLTGFQYYIQIIRPVVIGLYRPISGCSFKTIALWTPSINDIGLNTFTLSSANQVKFQANDTIGLTWTGYGAIPYEDSRGYGYCEDSVSPPSAGNTFTLVDQRYGSRAYSLQAFYVPSNPITPPNPRVGFLPVLRGGLDGSQLWTMVQTEGFATAGTLIGFTFYVQIARPVQLGLYRPVSGCTFTLLKSWSPTISNTGVITLSFTGSDQASFLAGDTIGYTWTGYGAIPYDGSYEYNYCDDSVGQPEVGGQFSLVAGRYGNRQYSISAIIKPAVVDFCANNPCLNGGQCCNSGANFTCQCPAGTVAPNCAKATRCDQSPCINGGTCVTVSKTAYSCTCLPGFKGANCEVRPCDNSVTQSIGFTPVYRGGLDGSILWTMIQTRGFPSAGVLVGFKYYVQIVRPIQIGLYRPNGGCKFTLLKSWTRGVTNTGVNEITLSSAERANFQAGDTIGITWTNYGAITYNDVVGYNYCEDNVGQPAVGKSISLVAGRYGSRVYSIESLYIQNGPAPAPAIFGYSLVPRAVDGTLQWSMVHIRGFQTAGTLIGFNFFVGAVRPLQLGLFRPNPQTCSYKLIKSWSPYINNVGAQQVLFTGSDQVNFQVGDTYGFTWTQYGVVPFDVSSDYNYCEDDQAQPAVGSTFTLKFARYGNRFYSIQAVYNPTVSASVCTVPTGCSPNPCLNGGTCDEVDSGFECTCESGFTGDVCEIPPSTSPCGGVDFSASQSIGFGSKKLPLVDGTILWTMVQTNGFPSDGRLTGFRFFASIVRPITLGLYRKVDGCTFTLLKSWSPSVTAIGLQELKFSDSQQVSFLAGDTIGLTWTQYGTIPYDVVADFQYCENSVSPPAIGDDFTLIPGRYGNRYYALEAFYNPTNLGPAPLTLGYDYVYRGGLDGSLAWTMVQQQGFQTDGVLVGFKFYVQIARPLTIGIYRPVTGCTFILLKLYTPWVANVGLNTVTLPLSDRYTFQKGDTIGITWTAYGAIPYEGVTNFYYCEDNIVPASEGSQVILQANRYGNRLYSIEALYNPTSAAGYYVNYCAANPCQNGGECCSTTSSYQCSCPANTVPPNCANSDPCSYKPCQNGGVCSKISTTAFSCQCKVGFSGDKCDSVVPDPCDAQPCLNGGVCSRLDNTNFRCQCSEKYYGNNCQSVVPPCSLAPCKNGATCVETGGTSYSCQCKIGYTGTNCATVVPDPCAATPCLNGGICTRLDNTNFKCQCSNKYFGDKCQTAVPPCSLSPCKNGATCVSSGGTSYTCQCAIGFSGTNCDTVVPDPCIAAPCLNGGTCIRLDNTNYKCQCTAAYFGDKCQTAVQPCSSSPCKNGGVCSSSGGTSYSCQCKIGFSGATCNTVVPDPCAAKPCLNGGECTRVDNTNFKCQCNAKYFGDKCQTAVPPCSTSPCKNGATCVETGGTGFTCQCKIGYSGTSCDTVVPDPCAAAPCLNGGTCSRVDNTNYKCQCTSSFFGDKCQTPVPPCSSSPCKNGATCVEKGTSYSCQCKLGYSGTSCDTVVPDPCASSPCKNSGKCTRLDNTAYSCQCASGYAGTSCETALPCLSSPCKNGGTCTNIGTTDYQCDCPDDYNDGEDCNEFQDPCLLVAKPCFNGGTCNRLNAFTYSCTCPPLYLGAHCEIANGTQPCDNKPCLNGGTCTNLSPVTYSCKCSKQWEGDNCGIVHCLTDPLKDCPGVPRSKYAFCDDCKKFIACKKRQRLRTCTDPNYYNRAIRKCIPDQATACAKL